MGTDRASSLLSTSRVELDRVLAHYGILLESSVRMETEI